jgi:hypothetical protein
LIKDGSLKVSSANEVARIYTFYGANACALSAIYTLFIIYGRKIIYYRDSTGRTVFLALSACDTTALAHLAHLCALVMITALYSHARSISYDVDYRIGTFTLAETAAYTFLGVYLRYVFLIYLDSITGTHSYAVTVAKTSEGTLSVTCKEELCAGAGCRAGIIVFSFLGSARAVTSNVGNLLHNVACGESHNFTNLFCHAVTAGNTEAGIIGHAVSKCLCITVASGEAASTAVCTGKAITNCSNLLVFLNCKEGSGKSKNYSTNKCNNYKNN